MYDSQLMVDRIKEVKKQKRLTNETLSELSGIPIGTLAKILGSETKDPQISSIIKISQALNVSADYIIFGAKEKAPESVVTETEANYEIVKKILTDCGIVKNTQDITESQRDVIDIIGKLISNNFQD